MDTHRRAGPTAERFVADPFNPVPVCTGPIRAAMQIGNVRGRADEQVIPRFRIELAGCVAAAIAVDPTVGQAVVVVSDSAAAGQESGTCGHPPRARRTRRCRRRSRPHPRSAAAARRNICRPRPMLCWMRSDHRGKIDRAALPGTADRVGHRVPRAADRH